MESLSARRPAPIRIDARDPLDALAAEALVLEPPMPHERADVLRGEAALLVDRLLVRVARGAGALDVGIGDALAALAEGDRVLRLGYSGIGDYARERLGMAARTAQAMARLARELRTRPLLAEAVRRGEVSARKAQAVLPVAAGDVEASWVARARVETVRALEAAARRARGRVARGDGGPDLALVPPSIDAAAGPARAVGPVAVGGRAADAAGDDVATSRVSPCVGVEEDEAWERVTMSLTPEGRAKLEEAMALAGKVLGATSPRWERLEAICAEYLGAHSEAPGDDETEAGWRAPVEEWLEAAKEGLEHETDRWAALTSAEPVVAPPGAGGLGEPFALDAELRRLAGMRARWDELLGHLSMLLLNLGLWRDMGFASFGHYCAERLGMAERTVAQRAALERRLHALPALRRALRDRRLSYEQARLVASEADDASVDAWIARAEATTCIALRRELEGERETQMCARGDLDLRVPRRVAALVDAAIRAVRAAEKRWLTPGACLERLAVHFADTWRDAVVERSTPQRRALERDRGLCQVPGCSRAAAHAHHVAFRSHGGGDEAANLVALCAAHHLNGVHRGYVRVTGVAPDRLRWELGVRPGAEPLQVFEPAAVTVH